MDFITEAVARLEDDDDDQVSGVFTQAMVEISTKLAQLTMNDEYQPYVQALVTYSKFKPLLEALAKDASFYMPQSAPISRSLRSSARFSGYPLCSPKLPRATLRGRGRWTRPGSATRRAPSR